MKEHDFRYRATTAAIARVLVLAVLCGVTPLLLAERPNIVMIVSDDQAYNDFGFMGHSAVKTPHLDRLAEQSARFVNGYVPTSLCRPSLATMLTGRYPHEHGIHFNHPPDRKNRHIADYLIRRAPTLPRLLSKAGYRTFQTGKHWEGHYSTAGFDEGMTLAKPHPIELEPPFAGFGMRPGHGNGDAGLVIGRRTMKPIHDFVDASTKAGKPFFVWYAPFLPHIPHNAAPKYVDAYRNDPKVPPHLTRYYAAITWFDDTVGALMKYLEEKGLIRNTIVLFVIDNGWVPDRKDPTGLRSTRSKNTPYEAGVRTPILIRWDGRVKSATHNELVSSVDILPTLLQAAGSRAAPNGLPGMSLLPAARGLQRLPARPVFGELYHGGARKLEEPQNEVLHRWVRSGDLKLIVPSDSKAQTMLFHVVSDPEERRNLTGVSNLVGKRAELKSLLDRWWNPAMDR